MGEKSISQSGEVGTHIRSIPYDQFAAFNLKAGQALRKLANISFINLFQAFGRAIEAKGMKVFLYEIIIQALGFCYAVITLGRAEYAPSLSRIILLFYHLDPAPFYITKLI
ncbi:hypothetical protein SDC9_197891 [bioreactor metagenome]|uniref:Uncharacterized protein n=1 Tax=bioreactor metagenome TaxID=1076179 RepID=A0A645IG57_9ZZZZ